MFAFIAILMLGCASEEERLTKELNSFHSRVESNLQQLKTHIEAGRMRNAELLSRYADVLKKQKPDMVPIIEALAADATTKGPMFESLKSRTDMAKQKIPGAVKSIEASRDLTREFNAINTATSVTNYNMALTDPINVLASMSDGKLAKVTDMSKDAATSEMTTIGSELVGNPTYGQWQTNSSGDTFWEWYGKYALFSSLFDRPVSYGYWSTHRAPSYYHDVGRDYYSSPKQKQQYQSTEQKVKKKFAAEGKKFKSPYSRPAQASTQTQQAAQKKSVVSAPGKYQSAYAQKPSQASVNQSQYAKAKATTNTTSTYKSRTSGSGGSRSFGSGGK
jgi:hypothetical protein